MYMILDCTNSGVKYRSSLYICREIRAGSLGALISMAFSTETYICKKNGTWVFPHYKSASPLQRARLTAFQAYDVYTQLKILCALCATSPTPTSREVIHTHPHTTRAMGKLKRPNGQKSPHMPCKNNNTCGQKT